MLVIALMIRSASALMIRADAPSYRCENSSDGEKRRRKRKRRRTRGRRNDTKLRKRRNGGLVVVHSQLIPRACPREIRGTCRADFSRMTATKQLKRGRREGARSDWFGSRRLQAPVKISLATSYIGTCRLLRPASAASTKFRIPLGSDESRA